MKLGKFALATAAISLGVIPVAASAGTAASASLNGVQPVLSDGGSLARTSAPAQSAQNLDPTTWVLIFLALIAGGYGIYEATKSNG